MDYNVIMEEPDACKLQKLWIEVTKLRRERNYDQIRALYVDSVRKGVLSPYWPPRNDLESGVKLRFLSALNEGGITDLWTK